MVNSNAHAKNFFLGQPILELQDFNFDWSTPKWPKTEVFWPPEKKFWSKKFFFGSNRQIFLYEAYNPIHLLTQVLPFSKRPRKYKISPKSNFAPLATCRLRNLKIPPFDLASLDPSGEVHRAVRSPGVERANGGIFRLTRAYNLSDPWPWHLAVNPVDQV